MLDEYAEAIRKLGEIKQLPVFDLNAILKQRGRAALYGIYFDHAHPNVEGQRYIAEQLFQFFLK